MVREKTIVECVCERCGRVWIPKGPELPLHCANSNCHSAYWNRPRLERKKKEQSAEVRETLGIGPKPPWEATEAAAILRRMKNGEG